MVDRRRAREPSARCRVSGLRQGIRDHVADHPPQLAAKFGANAVCIHSVKADCKRPKREETMKAAFAGIAASALTLCISTSAVFATDLRMTVWTGSEAHLKML